MNQVQVQALVDLEIHILWIIHQLLTKQAQSGLTPTESLSLTFWQTKLPAIKAELNSISISTTQKENLSSAKPETSIRWLNRSMSPMEKQKTSSQSIIKKYKQQTEMS
jgi:hypothetical protein